MPPEALIEQILAGLPSITVGVVGDLFLDRYLDIDARLTEPSLETGLDAYQVVRVRSQPGAAGTVINNLVALGVGRIVPIAVIGEDGEGYELRQALSRMPSVNSSCIISRGDRRTPTYTKPMLVESNAVARELNRLDIKNRTSTPADAIAAVIKAIESEWPRLNALILLDQVSEEDCGVVTRAVRETVAVLAKRDPKQFVLADSRERIGKFRNVCLKPNRSECSLAAGISDLEQACLQLSRRAGRSVFCTAGADGMLLADPDKPAGTKVPGYPVVGPTDPVGAGDSVSAALACAVAVGQPAEVAASFANLVASITVQQLGTTGVASPEQVRARWIEVCAGGAAK
jgi:rfaE bifunctional protein kinase chain/domain